MSLVLNETLILAKTRSQDLKSVLKLNCWGSGLKDVSLIRQLVNVEVLGLSCNEITTLEDFAYCTKLKELILRKNNIKNISEIVHLQNLPKLTNLWLSENPCVENTHNYRKVVLKNLPNLIVLDNIPVTREELQEIEELGNEIYEEIPYKSSHSSGSGPSLSGLDHQAVRGNHQVVENHHQYELSGADHESEASFAPDTAPYTNNDQIPANANDLQNDTSILTPNIANQSQSQLNESNYSSYRATHNVSRSSNINQPSRCLSLQGSITTLNNNNNNNNNNQSWSMANNILPKGGKSRVANILSAVLCLVKELDYTSCEVVQTALHCRMEETSQ